MNIYATFDSEGLSTGFYTEEIHGARIVPIFGPIQPDGTREIEGYQPNKSCNIPPEAILITEEQWQKFLANPNTTRWNGSDAVPYSPPPPSTSSLDVDEERDRRIAIGFNFNGKLYQAREQDLRNINGATTAATVAIVNGVMEGNLRWADPNADFCWIAADNSLVPMDAQTTIAFGRTAMGFVTALTMAGRTIKDRIANGEDLDIKEDSLWPSANQQGE